MKRNAYILLDTMVALGMVTLLAVVLAVSMGRQQQAERKLADSRQATRLAERVLTDLQLGRPAPSLPEANVKLRRLEAAQGPAGWAWVEVTASCNAASASLRGLVPAPALAMRSSAERSQP